MTPDIEEYEMIRSFLIGIVAGQRGMTPLAAIATATRRHDIAADLPLQKLLLNPVVAAGTAMFAAAEMAGDKMKTAPDRTVFLGLLARTISSGFAGATLAPPKRRLAGAALGIGTAIVSSYAGLAARKWAMRRWGQTATGFVEDAIVFASANAIANARPARV
jgi:uncharacterized membrane protein